MALRATRRALGACVQVAVNGDRGVFTLTNPPVNVLNRQTLTEGTQALKELEKDGAVRGLVVTGGDGRVFSAGLDITEFANPNEGDLREYWSLVQQFWLALYASPLVTVAAINGAAPAAGTMVALGCDYRVITENPKAKMGLNEAKLGLAAPHWLAEAYVNAFTSKRRAELMTIRGDLLGPAECLAEGIVDEVVPQADVQRVAQERLDGLLAIPQYSVRQHKTMFREGPINHLLANLAADSDNLVRCITDPSVQQCINGYLASLRKKA